MKRHDGHRMARRRRILMTRLHPRCHPGWSRPSSLATAPLWAYGSLLWTRCYSPARAFSSHACGLDCTTSRRAKTSTACPRRRLRQGVVRRAPRQPASVKRPLPPQPTRKTRDAMSPKLSVLAAPRGWPRSRRFPSPLPSTEPAVQHNRVEELLSVTHISTYKD